jgi:predicted nucleotidyltransferase
MKRSKTVLELTPEELQAYQPLDEIDRREREQAEQIQERRTRAWQVARELAWLLYKEYRAQKVAVFGSLAHNAWFTPWSDIDLAAWGIPKERFYEAESAVSGKTTEFEINLVDPENCHPGLREAIEQDGVVL